MSGFYPLLQEEADTLNANGGHEPLTMETYKPNRKRGDEGATYRLFWNQDVYALNPPGFETEEDKQLLRGRKYAVYDAHALWKWVKHHPKDPTNSFKISFESWCELRREYDSALRIHDPDALDGVPNFVDELPHVGWIDFGPNVKWVKRKPWTHWYCDRQGNGFCWIALRNDGEVLFRTFNRTKGDMDWRPCDGYFLCGQEGSDRIRKIVYKGWTDYYIGDRGCEVCYMSRTARGWTLDYTHDNDDEKAPMYVRTGRSKRESSEYWTNAVRGRLVSARSPDGNVKQFFTGPKGYERAWKWTTWTEHDGDSEVFFTGKQGKERVYRINRLDVGDVLHKRGSMHKEYIWKREILATNTTVFYEGGRNAEAIRCIVRGPKNNPTSCASTFFYGPRGGECARPYVCIGTGVDVETYATAVAVGDENRVGQIYAAPMA